MAINKREFDLSQSLMDLQSQYNALVVENKVLKASCFMLKNTLSDASKKVDELLDTVSILKSLSKKEVAAIAKKRTVKTK